MPRPHDGSCRCPAPEFGDGLLNFTVDCDHYDALSSLLSGLSPAAAVRLSALPKGTPVALRSGEVRLLFGDERSCSGEMTCDCGKCAEERAARIRRGVRPSQELPVKYRRAA